MSRPVAAAGKTVPAEKSYALEAAACVQFLPMQVARCHEQAGPPLGASGNRRAPTPKSSLLLACHRTRTNLTHTVEARRAGRAVKKRPTTKYTSGMNGWWQVEGAPSAEEWQAFFAGAAFFLTVIAATIALLQLTSYLQERREAARPYIVIDYSFRSILMSVQVKNVSGALASNVRLSADQPFSSAMAGRAEVMNRLFSDAYRIRQLAPGLALEWTLDRAPDYFAGAYPRNYEVTAKYDDPRLLRRVQPWNPWSPRIPVTYIDTFDLNIEQYGEVSADTDHDNRMWNIAKRNENRIEKISRSLANAADALQDANAAPFISKRVPGRRRPRQ